MLPSSPTREILQPIAKHYYHDGAPCVPLSPTPSTRNAVILYNAFKGMSDKTILRADYNVVGKPYAYFAGKEKNISCLAESNIRAERAELANILSSIGTAAKKKFEGNFNVYRAILKMKMLVYSKSISRDFRIGDIREHLGVIVKAHASSLISEAHERKVAKHRTTSPRSPEIRDQRLRQFIKFLNEKPEASTALITALDPRAEDGDFSSVAALMRVKSLIKDFLDLPAHKRIAYQSLRAKREEKSLHSPDKKSLTAFIKRHADDPDLQLFARLWKKMNQDDTLRGLIGIHSWARELTLIADVILGTVADVEGVAVSGHKAASSRKLYQKIHLNLPRSVSEVESSPVMDSQQQSEKAPFQRIVDTPEDERALQVALSQAIASAHVSNEVDSPYKGFRPSSQQHISGYLIEKSVELESLEEVPRHSQAVVTAPSASLLPPATPTKQRVLPVVTRNPGILLQAELHASPEARLTNIAKRSALGTQVSSQALPSDVKSTNSQED
jgi:hypothetical protein